MNKKLCFVSPTIGELLVKQLAHELKNYTLYLTFANYFGVKGLPKLQEFYEKRANEEKDHHYWILTYLTNANYIFDYPAIEANNVKIETYVDPFVASVEREVLTTEMIYRIYELAIAEKDFLTASWLYEKLIKEQIEEQGLVMSCRDIMEQDADILVKTEQILELLG